MHIYYFFIARHSIKRERENFICSMCLNCHISEDVLLQSFEMVICILMIAPITLLIALTLLATQPLPFALSTDNETFMRIEHKRITTITYKLNTYMKLDIPVVHQRMRDSMMIHMP